MTAESCRIFDGKKTPGILVEFPKLKPSNDKINSSKDDPRLGQAGCLILIIRWMTMMTINHMVFTYF